MRSPVAEQIDRHDSIGHHMPNLKTRMWKKWILILFSFGSRSGCVRVGVWVHTNHTWIVAAIESVKATFHIHGNTKFAMLIVVIEFLWRCKTKTNKKTNKNHHPFQFESISMGSVSSLYPSSYHWNLAHQLFCSGKIIPYKKKLESPNLNVGNCTILFL